MKRIVYLFFGFIMMFSCIFYVDASCTDEEIELLKEEASNIKVTYKHLGAVQDDDGSIYYNRFEVNFRNVSNDFYIQFINGNNNNNIVKLSPSDGLIKDYFVNGNFTFDIYSNKCSVKIDTIQVYIPKFNLYSMDYLCEGIDGDDFPLCGKYYEYDVSYDDFVKRVNNYRSTHDISSSDEVIEEIEEESIFDIALEFITKYQIYIVITLVIILIILIALIVIKRRKKRGILE